MLENRFSDVNNLNVLHKHFDTQAMNKLKDLTSGIKLLHELPFQSHR